jgi:hypothetical protein
MTKREMIELVLLRVSGGKLSNDVEVKRVDISTYFASAYNYATLFDYYERHNLMVQEYRVFGFSGEFKILEQQLCTLPVTPQKDTSRKLNYIVLPKKLMVLPGNRGLDSLFDSAESTYVKVSGQEAVIGLDPPGSGYFWFEKYPSENRVYIKGNDCTETLYIRMMIDAGDIWLDDDIDLPSGREQMVLDKMAEWFLGERMTPENTIKDNTDDARKGR